MFSCCKQESHTSVQGFKNLMKRLQPDFVIMLNKDDLSIPTLKKADVVVFGCPQEKFTSAEVQSLKTYINEGGSMLYLSKEGGDTKHGANGNELLQEYGITIKDNCLINTVQKQYLHPKQVLISDCILCDELRKVSVFSYFKAVFLRGSLDRSYCCVSKITIERHFSYRLYTLENWA
ncbi:hypothetical protein L7F22_064503 [Adiantum nelumboides]|nr:hypothetical protein [Adiantum nelumboides]